MSTNLHLIYTDTFGLELVYEVSYYSENQKKFWWLDDLGTFSRTIDSVIWSVQV